MGSNLDDIIRILNTEIKRLLKILEVGPGQINTYDEYTYTVGRLSGVRLALYLLNEPLES